MSEIALTRMRKAILEKCHSSHGALERHWDHDALAKKAVDYLVQQKLLEREMGDSGNGFAYRLRTTPRGIAAMRGDVVSKI